MKKKYALYKKLVVLIVCVTMAVAYMPTSFFSHAAEEDQATVTAEEIQQTPDEPEQAEQAEPAEQPAAEQAEPAEEPEAEQAEQAEPQKEEGETVEAAADESAAESEEPSEDAGVVLKASAGDYTACVDCGSEAGIPAGASLDVSELSGKQFNKYLKKTADTLGLDRDCFEYSKLLDIKIMFEGEEIQPESPVNVSIRLKDTDLNTKQEEINVVHFGEETEVLDVDVNNKKDEVGFETSGFSIYVITSTPTTNLDGKKLAIAHVSTTQLTTSNNKRFLARGLSDTTYNTNYLAADNAAYEIHESETNLVTSSNTGVVQPHSANEITEWTFEATGGTNQYYIKTGEGDNVQYLNITSNGMAVSDTPQAITVSPSTNANYPNRVRLSAAVGGSTRYVRSSVAATATSNGDNPYFTSGTSADTNCYLTLCEVEKEEIGDTRYTGVKISSQDLVDGESYMLYQTIYNPETGKYEDYVIDCDGSVKRAYDNGDELSCYGDDDSCPMWMLHVCTNSSGQPTGYYVFKNEKTGMILHPLADGTLLKEYDEATVDTTDGLTLPGKEGGQYTSKVNYWDGSVMHYVGYEIVDDNGTFKLQTAHGDTAQAFSFAKRKQSSAGLHTVETVDSKANGITMHMFNYPNRATIANVTGSDSYTVDQLPAKHASMTLTDGYPTFNNGTSSGSALFKPSGSNYQGQGNHLFLKDTYESTGYYEYNAFHNFANYNKNTGNFTVYSETGTPSPTSTQFYMKRGNFFPFNTLNTSASASRAQNLYNGDGVLLDYQDPSNDATMQDVQGSSTQSLYGLSGTVDYYFGMTMDFEFMMPKDGIDNGNPLIYEFNGDDDLWIYIDDVLILDIGGVHDAWSGTINFVTGEITGKVGSNGVGVSGAGGATTIKDCFKKAGVFPDGTPWDDSKVDNYFKGNTFVDYGSHSFNMFFMEHGAGASNLEMRFNLPVIEKGKVTVEKKLDSTSQMDYSNVSFAYQAFKKEGEQYLPLTEAVYEGKTDDEGNPVPVPFQTVTFGGVQYENVFFLKPNEAAVFSDMIEDQEYYVQEIGIDENFVQQVSINDTVTEINDGICRSTDATARNRVRVTYKNKCDTEELLITKRLAEGSTDNGDTFEFRVMLENSSGELVPYYQGKYYIKDDNGVYYKYEGGKLVPNGDTPYECTAGNNGTIAQIPPNYTVVIKDLLPGTDFYVDEIRVLDAAGNTKLLSQSGWNLDSRVVSDNDPSEISDATIWNYETNQNDTGMSSLGRIADEKDAKVVFTNSRKYGVLKIVKELYEKSADVTIPADTQFKISGPADYGTDGEKTVTYEDFTNGVYTEIVPTGTYTVEESGAEIDGYQLVTTYEPTNQQAVVTEGTEPTEDGTVTVINNYIPIEPVADAPTLKIEKVDQDSNPLEGVEFTLANGDKTMTATTDENGKCEFAITCGTEDTDLLPDDERAPNSDTYDMTLTEDPQTGFEPAGPWTVTFETKKDKDGNTEVTLSDIKEREVGGNKILNYIERFIHWLISTITSEDPNYTFNEDTVTLQIVNKTTARTVQVVKTFTGLENISEIPEGFKVDVSYMDNDAAEGASNTDIVLHPVSTDPHLKSVSADGTTYTWEVTNVRAGTDFSTVESGYSVSGYTVTPSVSVTGASNTETDPTKAAFEVPTDEPTSGQPSAVVEYTNTYVAAPAIGEIKAKKILNGRDWLTSDSFEFTITPTGNAPAPAKSSVTVKKNSTNYTESFGNITFKKPGTYVYTISETHHGETINGIAYDDADQTITIVVEDDGTGQLVAAEGSNLVQTAEFTNTYSKSGEGEVKAHKNLTGRNWLATDSFEFTITPIDNAPAFDTDTVTVTKDSTGYTESFGTVTFTEEGTYQWIVSETHKGETINGVAYDSEDQTVTIIVEDDNKGHLVAKEGSSLVQTASFTNAYSAEGEGEVKVKKTFTGRDWTEDDAFEFTITPVGDAPAFKPNKVTVTKDSTGYTESFGKVTFTAAGIYQYTITETHKGETVDGITYDSADRTITFDVEDNLQGSIVAKEGSSLVQTAEFTNVYNTEGEGEVKVKKNLTGRAWTTDDSFEFKITPIGDAPEFENDTVTVTSGTADYTKTFGTVTFTEEGTYQWKVTETNKGQTIDGVAYDNEDKIVTIVVKDNGKGKLVADTGSALVQTAEFTNKYSATGEGEVKVKKTLNGRDWIADDAFEFTITPANDKTPEFDPNTVSVTKDSTGYTESFGKITFTKAGTYEWTISETHKGETINGVAYDSADKTVTIVVKDDGKGHLVADTGSALSQTAEFTNTYSKSGEGEIKVQKNLTGRAWTTDDSFKFTITPIDNAPAFKPNTVTVTNGSTAHTESFGTVSFTEEGTYQWKITETNSGQTIDGIKYDSEEKIITIVVEDDEHGNLVAAEGSSLVQTAEFTNKYSAEGEGEVKVTKDFTGRDWINDDEFEFTITPVGDAPAFKPNTVTVTKDSEDYTESFGKVKFTAAGTYQYTIKETNAGETIDGITYDSAEKTVTFVVEDDLKGHIVAEEGSSLVQTAEFANVYKAEGKGEVKVTKDFTGRDWIDDDAFEFTITPVGNAPAFKPNTVTVTKDSEDYTESFGKVTFTKAGTYEYKIKETNAGQTIDGITYDGAEKTIKFIVKDDLKGHIVAEEGSSLEQTATFTNKYSAKGEGEVKVTKNLTGRDWIDDDAFEFTITPVGDAPAFKPNKVTVTKDSEEYTESFGKVTFTKGGTYEYTIKETNAGETIDGITYDSEEKTITFNVKDDFKGHIVAEEGSSLVQSAEFTNNYSATGEGEVKVKKNLTGRDWIDDDAFEFTITPVGDAPAFDPNKVTVTKDSTGYTESFGTVTFTKKGTYEYTIKETNAGETIDGVTYDSEEKTITFKVKDDFKGHIVAEEGSSLEQTAKFANEYNAKGEGEVKVQKVLEGRDWTDDDAFTFTISAKDGTPMPEEDEITITNADEDQTKSFGEITFTKEGTYTYTVKETAGTLGGVTYDETEHTVTIKTEDDLKGHIVAAEGSDLIQTEKITNTYATEGIGEIKVQKILEGRPWTEDDEFTFTISAEDGTPMPEEDEITITKADQDQIRSFGEITFTEEGTYTYTVKEQKGTIGGVTYDETDHIVTIDTEDDGQGHIVATEDSDLIQIEPFINPYCASPTQGEIEVQKILEGRGWTSNDEFTFTISAEDGAPLPEEDEITITKADADQTKSFGEIEFTEPGTYKYIIEELEGNDGNIIYDDEAHAVTIKVVDDGDGNLVAADNSSLYQTVEITNEYTPDGNKTRTGDDFNLLLTIMIMLTTAAIALIALLLRRRRYNEM